MGGEYGDQWRQSLASALEWWRDAGVETLAEDEPRDWLARPAPVRETAPEAVAATAAPVAALPDTIEGFIGWRMSDAAPEADWLTPRIAPAGPAGADLMILTDMPDAEDTDSLMSGPAGRLLDRMLAAIGLNRDSVHLAPLAWARPLAGQIPGEAEPKLIELALHHIGLVAPKKLLLLGTSANRVLGTTSGSASGNGIHDINHSGGNTKAVATFHPRFLMERPAAKAEAWKHLLLFSRGIGQ
ncbi:uracil-DNA glycosylase [Sphingomonas sp. LB-2]|uniref:uracil-DNA glycosylase family protein n=1 Tax=Sphingomonas caeni TaxID=2984949 RepID=UPI002230ABD1|nr:uracil-DNA glycosylase family protein [Sphingomonas caeni]MCW3848770.1 uracil-DNA glycosylase [Sphingomonas caeni]